MTITLTEARQLPHGQKMGAIGDLREYNRRYYALRLDECRRRTKISTIKSREDPVKRAADLAQAKAVYYHLKSTADMKEVGYRARTAGRAAGAPGSKPYAKAYGLARQQAMRKLGDYAGAMEKGRGAYAEVMRAAGREVKFRRPVREGLIPLEELAEQEHAAAAKL